MTNTYTVTGASAVLDHEPGAAFTHEFSITAEADMLGSGRIAIVDRRYRVVGTSRVHDTDPGGHFFGAYGIAQEAALLDGGHIVRDDPMATPTKPKPTPSGPGGTDKRKE